MIIKPPLVDAINGQIRNEFSASSQYIAIAVYFDDAGLPDLAAFFYRQSAEERDHAMKMVHFLLETGARPVIPDLPAVQNEFGGAAEAVELALTQEIKVTEQINDLVTLATRHDDHTSNNFLQWFVMEQVEEVDSMSTLLSTIKHAGGNLLLVEEFVRRTSAAGAEGGEAAD